MYTEGSLLNLSKKDNGVILFRESVENGEKSLKGPNPAPPP